MRTLLVLARVSNLPTVWSNCLAAWLLSGGGTWFRFGLLCLGATLLYTGGMFLNDAFDENFDRRYRPERPIVAGRITSRKVWWLSSLWLIAGWAIFFGLGKTAAVYATALLFTIVLYDLVHKRTVLAPVLMASCRFLLYLLAASVGIGNGSSVYSAVPAAAALAAYIIGLSYLARGESTGSVFARWTAVLLFIPALVAITLLAEPKGLLAGVLAVQVGWTVWSLWAPASALFPVIPRGVAGLLAGIALVDWVAAVHCGYVVVFPCLFLLALALQRLAPAT